MTNDIEKAIEIIQEQIEEINQILSNSNQIATIEALKIAIETLEKQVPKKPILYMNSKGYKSCPVCGFWQSTIFNNNYCGNCGQKLDWSGEDEN